MGRTLSGYIAIRFAKTVLGILLALFVLIVTVDFVEQLRRFSELPDVNAGRLYAVALLRAPAFMEKAFPFGCLFAAMITLAQLNQRMELVVARSAGVSAWQFLLPMSIAVTRYSDLRVPPCAMVALTGRIPAITGPRFVDRKCTRSVLPSA